MEKRNQRIEEARKRSVKQKRQKAKRRKRKIVNFVTLSLLIASITANAYQLTRNLSPGDFSDITFCEDCDKEFQDVNTLTELCIKDCIETQIRKDTHRCKDEYGMATEDYYYNFTDYNNIFSNQEITFNKYSMSLSDIEIFTKYLKDLTPEEKEAILIYYGTDYIYEGAKEDYKKYVGRTLVENNVPENTIEVIAKKAVHDLTGKILDNHWITRKENTL